MSLEAESESKLLRWRLVTIIRTPRIGGGTDNTPSTYINIVYFWSQQQTLCCTGGEGSTQYGNDVTRGRVTLCDSAATLLLFRLTAVGVQKTIV